MTAPSQPVQQVKLTELEPYHRQSELFTHSAESEIELLAADMAQRGLKNPIHVLPNGTIVCGHCRVRAAKRLQWKTIDAIVLHNLAEASDVEIEQHVILDNYARRQLRPLERAKCAYRLRELIHGGDFDQLSDDQQDDVYRHTRDRVGQFMGISGRHANRLMAIMDAPLAVQQAFDNQKLSLETAAKVARLRSEEQQEIAQKIKAGGEPRKVAQKYLRTTRDLNEQERSFRQLFKAIEKADMVFRKGFKELRIVDTGEQESAQILRRIGPLLEALADHAEQRQQEQMRALDSKLPGIRRQLEEAISTNANDG